MKRGKRAKASKENTERWLLTYADLMNLLLIFFIILYAMSKVDVAKYNELSQAMGKVFGIGHSSNEMFPPGAGSDSLIDLGKGNQKDNTPTPTPTPSATGDQGTGAGNIEDQEMQALKNSLENMITEGNLGGEITVSTEERGVKISIQAQYLFASGSSELEPTVLKNVEDIGKMLKEFPDNYVRVEGHTDTDPIKTALYPSNWELSSARATNVLRILVEKCSLDPKRISAVGYGEYQPLYPNDTEVNKAKNRRVDIVLLKQDFSVGEAGSGN